MNCNHAESHLHASPSMRLNSKYVTMSSPSSSVAGSSMGSGRGGLSSPISIMSGSCRELRSVLPVVRSPNKSMERSLGQIFLVFHNETKRALLPNEVTSLDTVKALFVRSFPRSLSMKWFDTPLRKIYVLDHSTGIFYELDDLSEVRHRAVLKIYEQDVDSSSNVGSPLGFAHPRQPVDVMSRSTPADFSLENLSRIQSAGGSMQCVAYPVTVGATVHQGHSPVHSFGPPQLLSPSRGIGSGQRHSVACLPELGAYAVPQSFAHVFPDTCSLSGAVNGELSAHGSGSTTPSGADAETRDRVLKMESQLANLTAWMQSTMTRKGRPQNGTSSPAAISLPIGNNTKSMVVAASMQGSTSDVSSTVTPQQVLSVSMVNTILGLHQQAAQLRTDLVCLRQLHDSSVDSVQSLVNELSDKVKILSLTIPDSGNVYVRSEYARIDTLSQSYKTEADDVEKNLSDLELLVEGIRKDVVNRRCRVNMSEVESMALVLSQLSRSLADLKASFPQVQGKMKKVMSQEMEVVVKEERFLKEEPARIDESLKRSKKLMSTLVTLKKLAMIQDKRPVTVPIFTPKVDVSDDDRRALLLSIQTLMPNHEARLRAIKTFASVRSRKRKLIDNRESLRFEKSLELTRRKLRPTDNLSRIESTRQNALQQMYQDGQSDAVPVPVSEGDSRLPVTSATTAISMSPAVDRGVHVASSPPKKAAAGGGEGGRLPTTTNANGSGDRTSTSTAVPLVVSAKPIQTAASPAVAHGGTVIISAVPMSILSAVTSVVTVTTAAISACQETISVVSPTNRAGATLVSSSTTSLGTSNIKPLESIVTSVTVSSVAAVVSTTTVSSVPLRSSVVLPPASLETSANSSPSLASRSVLPSSRQQSASPSPKGHVTFSDQVTEIHHSGSTNGRSTKRLPPPPPPRKAAIQADASADASPTAVKQAFGSPVIPAKPLSLLRKDRPTSAIDPIVMLDETMTVSAERPAQIKGVLRTRTNGQSAVNRPLSVAPLATVDSDSDSSVCGAELLLAAGTLKRNPLSSSSSSSSSPFGGKTFDNNGQGEQPVNGNGKSKEVFKVPPPVPVRKTSSLTVGSPNPFTCMTSSADTDLYSNLQDMKLECALFAASASAKDKIDFDRQVNKQEAAINCGQMAAGGGTPGSIRKCEETEIY